MVLLVLPVLFKVVLLGLILETNVQCVLLDITQLLTKLLVLKVLTELLVVDNRLQRLNVLVVSMDGL